MNQSGKYQRLDRPLGTVGQVLLRGRLKFRARQRRDWSSFKRTTSQSSFHSAGPPSLPTTTSSHRERRELEILLPPPRRGGERGELVKRLLHRHRHRDHPARLTGQVRLQREGRCRPGGARHRLQGCWLHPRRPMCSQAERGRPGCFALFSHISLLSFAGGAHQWKGSVKHDS